MEEAIKNGFAAMNRGFLLLDLKFEKLKLDLESVKRTMVTKDDLKPLQNDVADIKASITRLENRNDFQDRKNTHFDRYGEILQDHELRIVELEDGE